MDDQRAVGVNVKQPRESFRAVLLEMVYRGHGEAPPETVLSTGSGFFYTADGKDFLVTARHNFTGWDEVRNEPKSSRGVGPTHVRISLWPSHPEGGYDIAEAIRMRVYQYELFQDPADDESDPFPRWLEHPQLGPKFDVAALRVSIPTQHSVHYHPWSKDDPDVAIPSRKLWVTQPISIVGYPYGLNSNNLPLWVQGTIASEPDLMYLIDGEPMPLFIADARTREGQSGSPVIQFRHPDSVVVLDNGIGITKGTQSKLIGIYTGRVNRESDLGFVWQIGEVDRLCRQGVLGTTRPQRSADPYVIATDYPITKFPKVSAAHMPIELAEVLSSEHKSQRAFRWNRGPWRAQMHDLPEVLNHLDTLPDRVDRKDVRDAVFSELSAGRVLAAFISVMIWGYADQGNGPLRTRWALTGVNNREAVNAPVRPEVSVLLQHAADTVQREGPIAAFRYMNNEGHVKFLGPAFFTKWLYFASLVEDVNDPNAAPILDGQVCTWLSDHADISLNLYRTNDYERYAELLQSWGQGFGRDAAQVEQAIYALQTKK
ncbi:hypothetical protein BKG69_06480 [Mycobacteroides chelonae]|uniref:S1 family peptidase n=1 Tax=Mycobacteroides chelonae TaxID=1774 RepID=UPI0008AA0BA3|nr:serine protease [Mycobacteroides chelonae]OHT80547.1 hypothetical protein BKG69_06480 [Mycobacteroides chelonae]GLE55938.1 hypothetical protein NJBCHELONAE_12460 [Mycobacteroides chelonae]